MVTLTPLIEAVDMLNAFLGSLIMGVKACSFRIYPNTQRNCTRIIVQTQILIIINAYNKQHSIFGKFKSTWNIGEHDGFSRTLKKCMKKLDGLCSVCVNEERYMKRDDTHSSCEKDFRQYAISATKKNDMKQWFDCENQWIVDCRYCCNTPWI